MGEKMEGGTKPLAVVRLARRERRNRVAGELPANRILGMEFLLRLGIVGVMEIISAACSAPAIRLGLISTLQRM